MIGYFLGRVRDTLPGKSPPWWQEFVRECSAREFRGRSVFGFQFMENDNAAEGMEEAADGANYAMYEIIKARRFGTHTDESLALTAVLHAYELYAALAALRAKHHGSP
jgi:hypothetical protein